MSDEINISAAAESSQPVEMGARQLIESLTEMLRQSSGPHTQVAEKLKRLQELLDCRFGRNRETGCYEEAIQFAPWLTANAERLRQQQAELAQSLQALRLLASRCGLSLKPFADFAQLYREYDAAEQDLLEQAYPAPDWADPG